MGERKARAFHLGNYTSKHRVRGQMSVQLGEGGQSGSQQGGDHAVTIGVAEGFVRGMRGG